MYKEVNYKIKISQWTIFHICFCENYLAIIRINIQCINSSWDQKQLKSQQKQGSLKVVNKNILLGIYTR